MGYVLWVLSIGQVVWSSTPAIPRAPIELSFDQQTEENGKTWQVSTAFAAPAGSVKLENWHAHAELLGRTTKKTLGSIEKLAVNSRAVEN